MKNYILHENSVKMNDGVNLFCRAWIPGGGTDKAVVIFHGDYEHSGRLLNVIDELGLQDFAVFAWDARGNGNSEALRDSVESFSVYVKDADIFVRIMSEKYQIPIENMVVIGNSIGGVIATSWIHDYAPPVRAMVLAAPAFRIKFYVPGIKLSVPGAIPLLRLTMKMDVGKNVPSYVKAEALTHDKEKQTTFNKDPMISNVTATNILVDVHDTATRVLKDAGVFRLPTMIQTAGSDSIVSKSAQKKFFENISSSVKELKIYDDFFHAIYHEKEGEKALVDVRNFILSQFEKPVILKSLIEADKSGVNKDEFEKLAAGSFNPLYPIQRFTLNTVGRLSKGVRLGWKHGFDSGMTLDYVYKNCAQGYTSLGKLIDFNYLNSIGWRGIRQRRVNMRKFLTKAINLAKVKDGEVRIMDIAAGPGRYVLETIQSHPDVKISALLRDYKEVNIQEGIKLTNEMNLENVSFRHGDAFSVQDLTENNNRPNVAIVSGLYELFPENQGVRESLRGLSEAVEKGGYLVYTNQPWHPQIKFIARVLRNREGNQWLMRRRCQEEMDELVKEAGFEKLDMEIDQWGLFTVSIARKI